MDWTDLLHLSGFQSLDKLAKDAVPVKKNIARLWKDTYVFVVPYNERLERDVPGAPFATMAVWAESPGAACRALNLEIEADSPEPGKRPPAELLPAGVSGTYGDLLAAAKLAHTEVFEYASYRIATDGAFVHRVVDTGRLTYFFRSHQDVSTERPYAIALKFRRH